MRAKPQIHSIIVRYTYFFFARSCSLDRRGSAIFIDKKQLFLSGTKSIEVEEPNETNK